MMIGTMTCKLGKQIENGQIDDEEEEIIRRSMNIGD